MEKMIVPGPGHYNLPSLFDPKPTYEDLLYCSNPKSRLKQKSAPRYLDSLIEKTRREVSIKRRNLSIGSLKYYYRSS